MRKVQPKNYSILCVLYLRCKLPKLCVFGAAFHVLAVRMHDFPSVHVTYLIQFVQKSSERTDGQLLLKELLVTNKTGSVIIT